MTREKRSITERLQAGASSFACGGYLSSLDPLHRAEIYNALGYERLSRKNRDVNGFYAECRSNWPQTFYLMFLRTLGDEQNKEAFTSLARTVPYAAILRERLTPHNVEAMLIGASGLLEPYQHDEDILNMKRNFAHMANKYAITPMHLSQWSLNKLRPNNHPILRLSQAAMFLTSVRNVMDRILECRTSKDVNTLFGVKTSKYWYTRYTPANDSGNVVKHIGRTKTDLLGINLVVQMQFAYGSYINNETLRMRAMSLLENISAEDNSIIRGWNACGTLAKTAFDSQALIQLYNEYCLRERCDECPVGRRIAARAAVTQI